MPVKGKVKKIHNSSLHDSVGQIPARSAQHERQEIKIQIPGFFLPFTIIKDKGHRCNGQDYERCAMGPPVRILKESEDDSRVPDRNDMEKMGDDLQTLPFVQFPGNKMLRELVRYENQARDQGVDSPCSSRWGRWLGFAGEFVHVFAGFMRSGNPSETTAKHRAQTGRFFRFCPVSVR